MASINLEQLREERLGQRQRDLFQHQIDAIEKLRNALNFPADHSKGALLVLPTGAGKTYTAVRWLNDYVLPKQVRIIWLAHTFHLLDQAFETILQNAQWVQGRRTLNIRLISSHPSHEKVSSVEPTSDEMLIMSTQTAIANFNVDSLDERGNLVVTKFKKFVENCQETGLLLVLDEAHHAPAYGCRHLLMGIREVIPNLQLLGLTATPTYSDETRRGWLKKIFDQEVIYEAKQADLIAADILARPKFISMPTGREYEVDDKLYNRLMKDHKDLPDFIIDKLAGDQPRNDYIVNEYVTHRDEYGKTILFADRWFQCVYLKQKLVEKGVKADAVYSHSNADPGNADARNRQTSDDNKRILEQFKNGQGEDSLEVLINVRMLTEGTDVPSVKTVFITRQTTSTILMTQMIGRALRGKLAGGGSNKSDANIVLFVDNWKQLINWAVPGLGGGLKESIQVRGYYPVEYISIRLVEELTKQMNAGSVMQVVPFSQMLPVGWYQTEVVVDCSDGTNEETQCFTEFVMLYEHTKAKLDRFMSDISANLADEWGKEYLADDWIKPRVNDWIHKYFDLENDNIGNTLPLDIARIARHVAQRRVLPTYYAFEERNNYDLERLAEKVLTERYDDFQQDDLLEKLFSGPGSLWKTFYKTPDRFKTAFFGAKQRLIYAKKTGGMAKPTLPPSPRPVPRELTEGEKKSIIMRDGNKCLACGAQGKGVRLQIDHIVPVKFGGQTDVDNSQTLCSVCNRIKGTDAINFRIYSTPLSAPKELVLLQTIRDEYVERLTIRLVNFFYHCQAVCKATIHERRSGRCYSCWEIELYPGNNPDWLGEHKQSLLNYVRDDLGWDHVTDLKIIGSSSEKNSNGSNAEGQCRCSVCGKDPGTNWVNGQRYCNDCRPREKTCKR